MRPRARREAGRDPGRVHGGARERRPRTAFVARNGEPPSTGRREGGGRAGGELSNEAIERIAQRVAQLLEERSGVIRGGLVDAGELARQLGVTRAWVYQHAGELGGVRIGSGPRARLRFDVRGAKQALGAGERFRPGPPRTAKAGQSGSMAGRSAPLLPITPRQVRGLTARAGTTSTASRR